MMIGNGSHNWPNPRDEMDERREIKRQNMAKLQHTTQVRSLKGFQGRSLRFSVSAPCNEESISQFDQFHHCQGERRWFGTQTSQQDQQATSYHLAMSIQPWQIACYFRLFPRSLNEFDTWGGRRFCIDLWGLKVKSVPISFWRPSLKLFQVFSAKVPPASVWKPLSDAEKDILKAPSLACRSFKIFVLQEFSSLCLGKGAKEDSRSGKDWGQDFDTFRSRCRRDGGARNLGKRILCRRRMLWKESLSLGSWPKCSERKNLSRPKDTSRHQGKRVLANMKVLQVVLKLRLLHILL